MPELAPNLRAKVTFKNSGSYELGDFLLSVKSRYAELLRQAIKSAKHWHNEDAESRLDIMDGDRKASMLAQEENNWAVNYAVHFNEWAAFTIEDFRPVVDAWKGFMALFYCTNKLCGELIYVDVREKQEDALRCRCGRLNLNLRK
jgi:hypothetical protein